MDLSEQRHKYIYRLTYLRQIGLPLLPGQYQPRVSVRHHLLGESYVVYQLPETLLNIPVMVLLYCCKGEC